jgi:sugar-specific transcriptional regulator TrmB
MNLKNALKNIGLNDKEARIYLALLEKGVSTAYSVANKADVKRPTAYAILDDLSKRAVVHKVPDSNKKLYRVAPPETLLERKEDELNTFKEALPKLKAKENTGAEKTTVEYFEGVEGVKQVLNYKLDELEGGEIVAFHAKTSKEIMDRFDNYKDYNETLRDENITLRGVAPEHESLEEFRKQDKEYGRVFREINTEKYSSDVAIEVGTTFVRIFDPLNLQGLVIENSSLAETMEEIFEIVWESQRSHENG